MSEGQDPNVSREQDPQPWSAEGEVGQGAGLSGTILDVKLKKELVEIINIQLKDNQKARILDENLGNNYVSSVGKKHCKSQVATYNYLIGKK